MTIELAEPIEVTLEVAAIFDQLGVRYLVGGSLASSVHGIPRSTLDVDLVADLRADQVDPFVSALGDRFYVERDAAREAIRRRASFNIIHLATMLKIDIFILRPEPFATRELMRAQRIVVAEAPERALTFATAEDIVLEKLRWYRLGNEISDRQWNDVLGVLRTRVEDLDLAYLRDEAAVLGVSDLLERALTVAERDGSSR